MISAQVGIGCTTSWGFDTNLLSFRLGPQSEMLPMTYTSALYALFFHNVRWDILVPVVGYICSNFNSSGANYSDKVLSFFWCADGLPTVEMSSLGRGWRLWMMCTNFIAATPSWIALGLARRGWTLESKYRKSRDCKPNGLKNSWGHVGLALRKDFEKRSASYKLVS